MDKTGAFGWPLVSSPHFPRENTIACPKCGSTRWTMGTHPGARGTAPNGRWRMGDSGYARFIRCEACKHETTEGTNG